MFTIFQVKAEAYAVVLQDLRDARDNIDRAIAAIEALHEPARAPAETTVGQLLGEEKE